MPANINLLTTIDDCVIFLSTLLDVKARREEAAKILGCETAYDFGGHNILNLITDIKSRYKLIAWDLERKKLENMQKQLERYLSDEAKTNKALEDLELELG